MYEPYFAWNRFTLVHIIIDGSHSQNFHGNKQRNNCYVHRTLLAVKKGNHCADLGQTNCVRGIKSICDPKFWGTARRDNASKYHQYLGL